MVRFAPFTPVVGLQSDPNAIGRESTTPRCCLSQKEMSIVSRGRESDVSWRKGLVGLRSNMVHVGSV